MFSSVIGSGSPPGGRDDDAIRSQFDSYGLPRVLVGAVGHRVRDGLSQDRFWDPGQFVPVQTDHDDVGPQVVHQCLRRPLDLVVHRAIDVEPAVVHLCLVAVPEDLDVGLTQDVGGPR